MKKDIEIARVAKMEPIAKIAEKVGLMPEEIESYGPYKAKIADTAKQRVQGKPNGKLILVTAITPTPAGEGKTTVSIGLGDGMQKIGKNVLIALREPSLGPVFGMKGCATGGGMSQILPMEDINLHFTGDLHAISSANNLLCAMVDNHIYHGNELDLVPERVTVRRCVDMNDRFLRRITGAYPERETGFDITAASEVMATLCLAEDEQDLKERLGNIIIGYDSKGEVKRARDIGANGAMAVLLKDAIKPNLVQTMEHTPVLVHGGPFANIAHGCSTVAATKLALKLADYVITEAGFGADLGAEKFLDIKCRKAGLWPHAVVLAATVRALKYHGGIEVKDLGEENLEALNIGLDNMAQHIQNLTGVYGLPVVVAMNRFVADTDAELRMVEERCQALGVQAVMCEGWGKGGEGTKELAQAVVQASEGEARAPQFAYPDEMCIQEKIEAVAKRIYHADGVIFLDEAKEQLKVIEEMGLSSWPVCIAKTQMSFSDNAKVRGCPKGFEITVRSLRISAGAGFIVALAGAIMTMPGLPKAPAALKVDFNEQGQIDGLN